MKQDDLNNTSNRLNQDGDWKEKFDEWYNVWDENFTPSVSSIIGFFEDIVVPLQDRIKELEEDEEGLEVSLDSYKKNSKELWDKIYEITEFRRNLQKENKELKRDNEVLKQHIQELEVGSIDSLLGFMLKKGFEADGNGEYWMREVNEKGKKNEYKSYTSKQIIDWFKNEQRIKS